MQDSTLIITQLAQGTCQKLKSHYLYYETYDNNGESLEKNKILIKDIETIINLSCIPECIVINSDDYGYCKIILEEKTLAFIKTNLHKIVNPINRMLLISNISEMINDCLFEPANLLELISSHITYETEPILLTFMLSMANSILINKVKDKALKNHYYPILFDKILEGIQLYKEFQDIILNFLYTDDQTMQAVGWITENSPITMTNQRR